MMKVIIDPRANYRYMTYYLEGLRKVFGKSNIRYQLSPFKDLRYETRGEMNSGVPVIFDNGNKQYRVFFDLTDPATIEESRYEWCDVYAKVNPLFGDPQKYSKMLVLGPEFGLYNDNVVKSLFLACCNYLRGRGYTKKSFRASLDGYLYPFLRRVPLDKYEERVEAKDNYVFHASTLWYSTGTRATTNVYRGEFLRACKKANVDLEGGFFYVEHPDVLKEAPDYPKYKEEYKEFIYHQRLQMTEYIKKTKESFVVFNTPSVCDCHGWKLGEYLCMGKAIISMPLTREMPGEGLVHGENVHFVQSTDEIYDVVIKIKNDKTYREKLERGAREYYEKWLAPEVAIKRILEKGNIKQ